MDDTVRYRLFLWWAIALISVVLFLVGLLCWGDIGRFIGFPGLAVVCALFIFRDYLLKRPMKLGGFELDVESIVSRIFFLLFAILLWVIAYMVLFGVGNI
jgi:hypothetical protein